MLGWPGRARKKREGFAANRKEVKETKIKVIIKTDSVSIRFPGFPFFKLDIECARRIGIEAITSSKEGRGITIGP